MDSRALESFYTRCNAWWHRLWLNCHPGTPHYHPPLHGQSAVWALLLTILTVAAPLTDKSYHILLDSPGEKAVYHGMKPQIIIARLLHTGANWYWSIGNMNLFCSACNVSWNVICTCCSPNYDHYLSLQHRIFINHENACGDCRSPRGKHKLDQGMAPAHGNCGYASASLAKHLHLPKFKTVWIGYRRQNHLKFAMVVNC